MYGGAGFLEDYDEDQERQAQAGNEVNQHDDGLQGNGRNKQHALKSTVDVSWLNRIRAGMASTHLGCPSSDKLVA